jgi:hypothetical protein
MVKTRKKGLWRETRKAREERESSSRKKKEEEGIYRPNDIYR